MEPLMSDGEILERSKLWSNVMETFCKEEKFEEIDFADIQSPDEESEEISDDDSPNQTITNNNNNENKNTCKALVKVANFEGETSSDDFDECANQTVAIMKDQQSKWKKFVTPWVEKNKLDKTQLSTSLDEHIVHIEEHHHRQIHMDSDDDSLHSLDTANYIRSSRKNKRSSCTTTTIKKFSYVKGSRRHLQKKYGLGNFDLGKDLNKVLYEKYPTENVPKTAPLTFRGILGSQQSCSSYSTPPQQIKAIPYEAKSVPVRRRKSRPIKRRSDFSKRSISSSSSSSGSPIRPVKPKFRRSSKVKSGEAGSQLSPKKTFSPTKHGQVPKESKILGKQIDLTLIETSDSEPQLDSKKPISVPNQAQSGNLKAIPGLSIQGGSSINETGFLGASIINSTALSSTNPIQPSSLPNPMKKCLITPIKNNPEQINKRPITPPPPALPLIKPLRVKIRTNKTKKIEEIEKSIEEPIENNLPPEDNSKILLYCPTNVEKHKNYVSCKRFLLTREHFLETVGKKNSRRFIKLNSRKFPFEFDCTSRIYFKVPDESEESASSDEDVLYMFGREGKIIVETVEQRNNG
ncbi:probable serine/threonine-protein kinase nek3 isoform X2 [Episyrphus balteatus]|uniref:probable serine/threonine-protein kinase nek3 isoform X2 n=1 Tax=Episyrphus balteatus TaxID=286459 RepID=UPI00248557C9|nr:probable serine/threonine-protein kinase nek3 isoform X2 [Episyrphus balteatus]